MLNSRNTWARLENVADDRGPELKLAVFLTVFLALVAWLLIAAAIPDTLAGEVYKKSHRPPRTTTTWQTTYGGNGQPTGGFPITTNHPEAWLVFIIDDEGTTESFAVSEVVWQDVEIGDWFNSETMDLNQ